MVKSCRAAEKLETKLSWSASLTIACLPPQASCCVSATSAMKTCKPTQPLDQFNHTHPLQGPSQDGEGISEVHSTPHICLSKHLATLATLCIYRDSVLLAWQRCHSISFEWMLTFFCVSLLPNSYVKVLTSQYCRMWLYLEVKSLTGNS